MKTLIDSLPNPDPTDIVAQDYSPLDVLTFGFNAEVDETCAAPIHQARGGMAMNRTCIHVRWTLGIDGLR
jgi:hypothetical protein